MRQDYFKILVFFSCWYIQLWKMPENQRIQLVPRETALPAGRSVPSVFASASTSKDGNKTDPDADSGLCKASEIIDVIREPVLAKSAAPEDGVLAYEQKNSPVGWIKIGDCFLVKSAQNGDRIVKLEKIYDVG